MKNAGIILMVLEYLGKLQYLVDEGFTFEEADDIKSLTLGVRVIETGDRYCYRLSEMKARCYSKEKFDTSIYRGKVKSLVEGMNEIIDGYKHKHKVLDGIWEWYRGMENKCDEQS